jgi:branched-chain amino acid transport system substrate-binding protein
MNLIIEAIRKAGLNRVLIRDLLTDNKTFQNYKGVTGTIVFDGSWNDVGDIFIAEVSNGRFHFSPAPPLEKVQRVSIRE